MSLLKTLWSTVQPGPPRQRPSVVATGVTMSRRAAVCLAFLVFAHSSRAGAAGALQDSLAQMSQLGGKFDPAPLLQLGVDGMRHLLDELLPQTAAANVTRLSPEGARKLVGQLAAADSRLRQSATEQLKKEGHPFELLLRDAAQATDPEMALRAREILVVFDQRKAECRERKTNIYAAAFEVYLKAAAKDDACMGVLAERTYLVLDRGLAGKAQDRIVQCCVVGLAASGNDAHCDVLIPLLTHKDEQVAARVARTMGYASGNRYFPSILFEALKSDRPAVVDQALAWAPNCWDPKKSARLKELVAAVFEGENEELKFKSCFVMMHSYQDQRAVDYLLEQINGGNKARRHQAIAWVGDACNHGRKAYPKLLQTLIPLLKAEDAGLGRVAANALGVYQGEEVVEGLIPLLGGKHWGVAFDALGEQRDKEMLRRCLNEAAKNSPDATVRQKTKELLTKIDG